MCKDTWITLDTLEKVSNSHIEGWEIQYRTVGGEFGWWMGDAWRKDWIFRGRPKQPRTVTVTSECWREITGVLTWRNPNNPDLGKFWKRFPAGDITGEIEE